MADQEVAWPYRGNEVSNVIPFHKPKEEDVKCSFCGTPKSKTRSMLSNGKEGAEARHICNLCAVQAKRRTQEES